MTDINYGKVVVLYGGKGPEREISLLSGKRVYLALCQQNIDVSLIDTREDNLIEKLLIERFNRAFIALHGKGGEDGVLQGVLEYLNIPYIGSKVGASSIAMDKIKTKLILKGANLPILPWLELRDESDLALIEQKFNFPLAIKPIASGSSLGVSCVNKKEEIDAAFSLAKSYNCGVMVEPWKRGREFAVSILQQNVLPIIEISTPPGKFYDYEQKYFTNTTKFHCPANLDAKKYTFMQSLAQQSFHLIGCHGFGRIDFLMDEKESIWIKEINTIPGLTEHSLMPLAASVSFMDYKTLIIEILRTSLEG